MKTGITGRTAAFATILFLCGASTVTASTPRVTGLPFIANEGQTDARVAFSADTRTGTVFVTRDAELVYALRVDARAVVLRERLVTNTAAGVRGEVASSTRLQRFVGAGTGGWQQNVATYERLALGTPWPGIDMHLRSGANNVEKIFDVAPKADPAQIAIEVEGARRLSVDDDGVLVAQTSTGTVRFTAPIAWQGDGSSRRFVDVAYAVAGTRYGFRLGNYDPALPLTIDPSLLYSTYHGGSAGDAIYGIAVDSAGSAYVTGGTFSANFPLVDAWDGTHDLQNDIFVSKFTSDGTGLVFSTLLGGSSFEDGRAVALDAAGNLWVTGVTFSNDFPVVGSSTTPGGAGDAFVARFDSGGTLTYARYLGGSAQDDGKALTIDTAGNAVVMGGTKSTNFPALANAMQPASGGGFDAYVVKLSASNPDTFLYSTYLGGNGDDCAFFLGCDVALDSSGEVYVVMDTTSTNLPVPKAITSPFNGAIYHGGAATNLGGDGWIARLQLGNNTLSYGSYLGGSGWDEPYALTLDATGGVWVVGDTGSTDFPTLNALTGPGSYNGAIAHGGGDGFVMRLTWSGGANPLAVSFSTYLGGGGTDHLSGVEILPNGDAWLGGTTPSVNMPTASALQTINRGKRDGYFARLAWNGTALALPFASYHGGSQDDTVNAITIGPGGDLFFAGDTQSIDYPIARPIQATAIAGGDAIVGRLAVTAPPVTLSSENGYTISPRGTIRVLLLFAEVDYSDPQCSAQNIYSNSPSWPPGQVPLDAGTYFDHYLAPGAQPQGYLTKYYYQGSLGQYLVLGDYYPQVVTVPCANLSGWWGHNAVISQLNALTTPFQTAHTNPATGAPYGLDDFDFWGNEGSGVAKSNYPNGIIDAILVIWRNNHSWCGACGLGLQGLGANTPLQTKGVNQVGSYNGVDSGEGAFGITISEYFHALFGGNNWHTGSGAGNHTFPFPGVGSYSTTQGQVSNTMAGYDRFHMGWKNPLKQFLLSALDTNGVEIPSDISVQTHPFGATFVLRDYYATGDAIRIKLPHFNWQAAGDVKNQYLWLENHQRSLSFDRSKWENVPGKEAWTKGLYVQLQVGKDIKSGPSLYTVADNLPNGLASWLLQYTAEGHYDYMYRFDKAQPPSWNYCNWMNANIPTDRGQSLPNPFTGFSDVYRYIDSAPDVSSLSQTTATLRPLGNGTLLSNDKVQTGLSEMIASAFVENCNAAGDSQDAFNSASSQNLSLGIGTNPAAVPAYTLRSLYGFGGPQNVVAGYENRKIRLNNLLIEITGENIDGQGSMRVDVSWDKPRIKDNVRWTGNVDLRNDPLDPQTRTMEIELAAGKQICLDRGFSPTKDNANVSDGLFTDPTQLNLAANTVTHLESGARLNVLNGSSLSIEPNAVVQLDANATIAFTPQPAATQWAPCNTLACTPAPMAMVAWWSLDETTGTTSADRAGSNHGVRVNGPTPDAGVVNGALRFTSAQINPQTIRVPHAPALNFGSASFTFDAWLKVTGPGIVLSKHDDSINRGYEVYIDVVVGGSSPLRPVGMRINGSHHHPSNCNVTLNQWTHVSLVVDRGSPAAVRCYIGGTLAGTSALFTSGTTDNSKELLIGNSAQFAGLPPYGGVIDEVELFNKALSPAAIAAIPAAGAGGKCRDGCLARPANLGAWWTLDEPAGTQALDIVSGANGTISGATHLVAGANQGALTFDGVDDFVEVPNHAIVDIAQGNFTVDAWVRTSSATDVDVLLDKRTSGASTKGWSLFVVNGRVGIQLADGIGSSLCSPTPGTSSCTNYVANGSIADGRWHFVAVSVDRTSATGGAIFIDGSRVLTFNPTARTGSLSNAAPLRFGKRSFEDSGFFAGELDEVELFQRALSDAELGAIYAAGAGGKCKARIDVPASSSLCTNDAYVDVPITICNDSPTSRQYFYTLHGLAGGDPVTGIGCNLAGPTSFTYLSAAPVTVPAMSCVTVTIRVARPAGMTVHNKTSCYEAVAWDTVTGTRIRDTGVLRAKFTCPITLNTSPDPTRLAFRSDTRAGTPIPPPEAAVEILGSGALRANERATYDVLLRNAGRRPLGARATLAIELPPGLQFVEATGNGFTCGAPSIVEGATKVTCGADSTTLAPGASMSLRLVTLPAWRPENVMTVCARVQVPGSVAADNRACLQRDYGIPGRSADLGDAPDSSNHRGMPDAPSAHQQHVTKPPAGLIVPADTEHGTRHAHFNSMMFAYGMNIIGRFPTVFDPEVGAAQGPIHWQPSASFWLGREVSGEHDADTDPDEDGRTNIEPISSSSNRDAKDDGVVASTVRFPRCSTTTFDVTVTLKDGSARPLLNAWIDFNRDGDWEDTFQCQSGNNVLTVREWAVQNQSIAIRPGFSTVRTATFTTGEIPTPQSPMWMRVTLSETPAPAPGDGRGPFAGYRFGETEDYLLPLSLP